MFLPRQQHLLQRWLLQVWTKLKIESWSCCLAKISLNGKEFSFMFPTSTPLYFFGWFNKKIDVLYQGCQKRFYKDQTPDWDGIIKKVQGNWIFTPLMNVIWIVWPHPVFVPSLQGLSLDTPTPCVQPSANQRPCVQPSANQRPVFYETQGLTPLWCSHTHAAACWPWFHK